MPNLNKPGKLRLQPPAAGRASARRADQPLPSWPTYTGQVQLVGVSPSGRVTVYVDPSLGDPALQNANDLLADADRVANANDAIFAATGGPVSVILFALDGRTDGTGGADHGGCDFTTGAAIEVCVSYGDPARVSALFEAELSECSMGGSLCGFSNGEALSRWCAAVVSNNALGDFATAPVWFQDGMPDYVNQTDPTDGNEDSTGCGMAFLSWLRSEGQGLDAIAQAMVNLGDNGTLADLYASLTGDAAANAWPTFQTAVQSLPSGVNDDDPFGSGFGVSPQPPQLAHLSPATVALAGRIFTAILSNLAAGKPARHVVDQVHAMIGAAAKGKVAGGMAGGGSCRVGSHRLQPPGRA